ncbi:MAG: Gar1/Naf1 family protein [Candidatus Nezhaarchaeota archaeon]|nr:Gar1/Naf1 family protein [Candidatus Nezhaarchaeota archaeon]
MRRLGRILHILKNGLLLVKLQDPRPPLIGSNVLSRDGEVVGVVRDVIGNVSSPYVVVKPLRKPSRKLVAELYIEDRCM